MLKLLVAALVFAAAQPQPAPRAGPGKPPAVRTPPKDPAHPSILPVFDASRATTYIFRSIYTSQQSHGNKEFDPSVEQVTFHVCVTPLSLDAEKNEAEVEVEFTGVQASWSMYGFTEKYDSTVAYRPKQTQRPKRPGMEPDGAFINDVPLDRVLYERFKPLHGAKVHLRMTTRGEVLELKDEPLLPTSALPSISPCTLLYSLFVLPATNTEPDFNGVVRANQQWTCEHTDAAPKDGKAATVRIADYRVRTASKGRVEAESVARFKLPDGAAPPRGYVYEDKAAYVWDPAAGQLAAARLSVTNKSSLVVQGKDHGFSSSSEVTIDRVRSEKRRTPNSSKPAKPLQP
ncbi:MAG TPA: hypothetical protein VFF65_00960 [Phycisphaerales bacterium]|nr:hypothetical protein [Phycisphaerales bacterium]